MKEVFLAVQKSALVAVNEDGEEALAGYPAGTVVRVRISQTRSNPHNNFFFAFLKEVFSNWPETHKFQPKDYNDHLRAWLLVKGGFSEIFESELMPDLKTAGLAAMLLTAMLKRFTKGKPVWMKIEGRKISAAWPQSIAFDKMDEEEFKRVTTIIFAVIYAETGMKVEEYYDEWQIKHGRLPMAPTRIQKEPDPEAAGDDLQE
jgi:hypothetical protein